MLPAPPTGTLVGCFRTMPGCREPERKQATIGAATNDGHQLSTLRPKLCRLWLPSLRPRPTQARDLARARRLSGQPQVRYLRREKPGVPDATPAQGPQARPQGPSGVRPSRPRLRRAAVSRGPRQRRQRPISRGHLVPSPRPKTLEGESPPPPPRAARLCRLGRRSVFFLFIYLFIYLFIFYLFIY